ncbi:50S ribosomal protein L17 [Morella rubra]|uniref:50S ribosomal protein L17 n=1 Tax=Morella rubra TaxID=262757 RepID=A0A6A1VCA0_9ROSI|nr:50S ribosomal protein L17 [Morella rubra]
MTKFRKLSRPTGHRMSMLRTMVSQLVKHERIETTVAKAKEVRRLADNMVQLGKEGSLCAARRAAAFVRGDDVIHKLFKAYRYKDRAGGYTRMLRTRIRVGDAAPMAYIERAAAFVRGDDVIHKLFTELAYRYKDRAGGYTRMLRTRIRVGDAAPMAYIEFIDRDNELRQSKPPNPQPTQKAPLDPWTRSKLSKQFAPPKEDNSESET